MFAGGYWGNTGTGGVVSYVPLGSLETELNESDLILSDEEILQLRDEDTPLVLADEKTVVIEDDDSETDLAV